MCYSFDPQYVRDRLVAEIAHYARQEGFTKAVLGISGGKDSTVAAALLVRALGKDNVYGVLLPDGQQFDIMDSYRVCDALDIPHFEFNIQAMHQSLLNVTSHHWIMQDADVLPYSRESDINVAPRLRMTVLRYITQALGARLAGTGNLSESTVGYCTKDGDTSCDFSVLGNLTSVEVVQVGLTMAELPQDLVLKTPADGLSGMSDEEKLGVSYLDIHHFLRRDAEIDKDIFEKIAKLRESSAHKRRHPPAMRCEDTLWDAF